MSAEKYKNLKVKELQELLQKHGIPHTGKKEELIDRLVKYDEAQELATLEEEFGDLEEFDESKLDLADIKPLEEEIKPIVEEADISKETETKKTAAVEEETTTTEKKLSEPVTKSSNSNFKFTPITFDNKKTEPASSTTSTPAAPVAPTPAKVGKISPTPASPTSTTPKPATNDAEKALERAKRFGIQLNEKAKKDIRAQRFGLPAATPNSPKTKSKGGIDPEVLKKRAERFGLTNNKINNVKGGKIPVTVDPAEEEKKRKRAERFNSDASKKQKAE